MKNIYANKALCEDVSLLDDKDITRKRFFHFVSKPIIVLSNKKKIVVYSYPKLEKDEQYIFAVGHSFPNEIAANLFE